MLTAYSDFTTGTARVGISNDGPIDIFYRTGGRGPGMLLLHGHPQTSHIWRYVAPALSERHTVVAADLRGYGQSSKPRGSQSHVEYSKREMAKDMVELMRQLGFDSFAIVAHDRGARVSHRLALDHPSIVTSMVLLDIAPTLWMYETTDRAFALGYWHWFFYPQPFPGPENVIGADPRKFWDMLAGRKSHRNVVWTAEDVAEYQKYYFQPDTIHSCCEDYRASVTIDAEHDQADLDAGRKITVPLRVLWGGKGVFAAAGDIVKVWQEHSASSVTGRAIESGHYIPEESPVELLKEIRDFLV